MGPWDADEEITVGKRRRRAKRRREEPSRNPKVVIPVALVVLLALAAGGYWWLHRPTGLDALPNPAIVAPGGFRASVGDDQTITVGLEVRNVADAPLMLIAARIVAPAGLTPTALSILSPGPENEGFSLKGDLPPVAPLRLGTKPQERNAIVAARFTVNCPTVLASAAPTDEQIFVTIQVGDEQREEEVTPPVVGDLPWLTATAARACAAPASTESPEPPLPQDSPTPGAGG